MKSSSYLKLSRHNVYTFRRRIPKSLIDFFITNELRISTNTSNKKTALQIARNIANESDLLFEQLKNNKNMAVKKDFTDLRRILKHWQDTNYLKSRIEEASDLHEQEIRESNRRIEELKVNHVHALNQQGVGYKLALDAVKSLVAEKLKNNSDSPESHLKLSELVKEFLSPLNIVRRNNALATVRKDRDSLKIFIEIVGDKLISELTQADASKFADMCPNFGRKLNEVRSVSTVNNYMNSVGKFSRWIVSSRSETGHKQLEFSSLRYKKTKRPSIERAAFTEEEALKILGHPLLLGFKQLEPVKYWLPYIAAYSGARLEEITQLSPTTDIYKEDDVWVIDINDTNEKSVKNFSSIRRVPIHSKLIKNGFLEYVDSMKAINATTLFPDETTRDGRTGKNAGKRVNRFIQKSVGIENKSLHSFRHTFATILKRGGVNESVAAEILGHKHGGITYDRYGKGFLSDTLKSAIEKISFE